jgi:plasmid stabilization system protein ParE
VSLPVHYRESALLDAEEARNWYESRQPGLGERFVDKLTQAANLISEFPYAAPEVHKGIRKALVSVFWYRVYYVVEPEKAVILALYHPSRAAPDFEALL